MLIGLSWRIKTGEVPWGRYENGTHDVDEAVELLERSLEAVLDAVMPPLRGAKLGRCFSVEFASF
jgi:hypothetical protein